MRSLDTIGGGMMTRRDMDERILGNESRSMPLVDHPTSGLSEQIIGAAIEVHRHLGPGLMESAYQMCLCRELMLRAIPFQREVPIPIVYKGIRLERGYVLDLLVGDALIVETKSVEKLQPIHSAQLMTYMKLCDRTTGLLINFNVDTLINGVKRKLR